MKFLKCLTWLAGNLIVMNTFLSAPILGSFALRGTLKFTTGHQAGEILLEFWEWSEIFCHHLSSLVEKRTADLIVNIQTEIGPHRWEKSTWHQRFSILPHLLFLLQSQSHRWFLFFFCYCSVSGIRKKMFLHIACTLATCGRGTYTSSYDSSCRRCRQAHK